MQTNLTFCNELRDLMKLKYKKVILLTTLSVMGIGLLTLSLTNDKTQAKSVSKVQEESTDTKEKNMTIVSPTVAVTPTPAVLPVYNIEKNSYPKVQKLFKSFYEAKNNRDVNTIKKLLSDPSKVESKKELEKKTEYIDEYKNIKTYTKKSFSEGTYIVYVYHEIKFAGIKTAAPGLSKFYVITDKDGKLKIFSGNMDTATKEYYDKRNKDKDVVGLIKMTNKKSNKAIKKDKDLKIFWKKIDKLMKKDE